jgi:very-short-patch-repair endonuclease
LDEKSYAGRDAWLLRAYGERTIRFANGQVLVEGANVLAAVLNVLKLS